MSCGKDHRHSCEERAHGWLSITWAWRGICLSVTFVHCAQTAEDINTISFKYDSPMSLPDCVNIWLTSVNPYSPILPKVSHPLLIWFGVLCIQAMLPFTKLLWHLLSVVINQKELITFDLWHQCHCEQNCMLTFTLQKSVTNGWH